MGRETVSSNASCAEYAGFDVIGTEISDTAGQFANTVQWDFHDVNGEWVSRFDFVYSNSLDHAWNPKFALQTWLNQLNPKGRAGIGIHTLGIAPSPRFRDGSVRSPAQRSPVCPLQLVWSRHLDYVH